MSYESFEFYVRKTAEELKDVLKEQLMELDYEVLEDVNFIYGVGSYPVLLVAHIDTVHLNPPSIICYSKDGVIMSPQGIGGDDRCGVYIIMELLKNYLNIKPHILFTDKEERGAIGAYDFSYSGINPDVNYIIEFDRRGSDDAVFYKCDNQEFVDFVEQFGFKKTVGIFSDISVIAPDLGVAAVNLSSGFNMEHTYGEYVVMPDVENTIRRACEMICTPSKKFVYIPAKTTYLSNWKRNKDSGIYYDESFGYKELMFLSDDIEYIELPDGELVDASDYLIDSQGNLYYYDWYQDYAIPAEKGTAVKPLNYTKSEFDPSQAFITRIVNYEDVEY